MIDFVLFVGMVVVLVLLQGTRRRLRAQENELDSERNLRLLQSNREHLGTEALNRQLAELRVELARESNQRMELERRLAHVDDMLLDTIRRVAAVEESEVSRAVVPPAARSPLAAEPAIDDRTPLPAPLPTLAVAAADDATDGARAGFAAESPSNEQPATDPIAAAAADTERAWTDGAASDDAKAAAAGGAAAIAESEDHAGAIGEPAPPTPPAPPPRDETRISKPFDWEQLVGVHLFSWVAGVAMVLAGVFFVGYSIQEGWLGPPVRMAIGLAVGIGLLAVCEWRGRDWRVTADALDAAGVAILFSTIYASNALWHLLPQLPTFALMALVTAVAVTLSIRRNSIFIALLGLVGGFATPMLLSTGEDRPIGLFAYLLLLNAGLSWVARRRRWPLLLALSVAFTAVYQWGWVIKFVVDKPAELPIAAVVFLLFPALVAVSRFFGPIAAPDERDASLTLGTLGTPGTPGARGVEVALARRLAGGPALFEHTATVSALLPLLFALCMGWVPAFGEHHLLLFGFLFLLDVGLVVLTATVGPWLLHPASALATLLVFAGWLDGNAKAAWPEVLAVVSLFVVLFLFAPTVAARLGRPLEPRAARARLAAPLLLFTFPALVYLVPGCAAPALPFGVLFVLLAVIATIAIRDEQGVLHHLAAFFALVTEAVWSAMHLAPETLHAGLMLYGAFGLFYLGVPLVARRLGKRLLPEESGAVLLIASLALLLFLAAGSVAHIALWGMALLLAILNLGLLFDMRPGRMSLLGIGGMALSWVVIAVWWATAMVASLLLPALVIVGGFSLLLVGGNLLAERRAAGEAQSSAMRRAVYLGLVGHLFLLYVARQGALATPPWPLFGVLSVLDLAILVAALYARRADLHLGAIAASQVILMAWIPVAASQRVAEPAMIRWEHVGFIAQLVVCALGLVSLPLARRRGADHVLFPVGAAAGLLGGMVVVAVACASYDPTAPWVLAAQLPPLVALAVLAARTGWFWLMLAALLPCSLATALWDVYHYRGAHWTAELLLALGPYVVYMAWPLALGRRAQASKVPHLAAVLASAAFFLFARHAIVHGGGGNVIGALPVAQALALAGLLVMVLRIERPEERDRDRLALLAAAALGFITLAIPLQLEKQWITIGWALEAAALAWLHRRLDHKGLLAGSVGLAAAVVARLSLNRAVFTYHPRSATPIFNWYLYSYLVSAAALLAAATQLARTGDRLPSPPLPDRFPRPSRLVGAGGALLLFLLLNIEIADFYSTGSEITFNFSGGLAQDLTYTLGWALFAIGMLATGIVLRSRGSRIAALLLLVITVLKCFLHDLWRLGGLYRVGSFVGLAISLALVAIVLQRFVLVKENSER